MSELLLEISESAKKSRDDQGAIQTSGFLETCKELLPIIGEVWESAIRADLASKKITSMS